MVKQSHHYIPLNYIPAQDSLRSARRDPGYHCEKYCVPGSGFKEGIWKCETLQYCRSGLKKNKTEIIVQESGFFIAKI